MTYIFLILGLFVLLLGGKFLVDGASSIAARLGLSQGLIGLTVVAFGTSAPELLVSITAALKGNSDIAIGNVVGSNISNITLVLGSSAIVYPIFISRSVIKLDYVFTIVTSTLFFILAFNGRISIMEGILLTFLLLAINWYFFKKIERVDKVLMENENSGLKVKSPIIGVVLILLGIVGLYGGSELVVDNAVIIAKTHGISERIIGVTVIAIGTSLPELATSILAAIKKETDIAIGNILGSNIMNVLSIIGITAIIKPIDVAPEFLQHDFIWMIALTVLLFPLMRINYQISRINGGILVFSYALYLYFLL